MNGFPDCQAVESEDVAIVQMADIAFCCTVWDILPLTPSLFV
jgi:hypothetical protein